MSLGTKVIYADPEIEKIIAIEGNNRCVDCGSDDPQWASLNNSVFVCLNCAGIHRNLGPEVSFIRSLVMDSWEDKQLKLLFLGGNTRFISNLEDYGICKNNNHLSLNPDKIEKKYLYKASEYYRELLDSELNMTEAPQKPVPEDGSILINSNDLTGEINSSKYTVPDNINHSVESGIPIEGEVDENNVNIGEKKEEKKEEKKGFFGKVGGFFSGVAVDAKKQYKKVEDKVSKIEFKEGFKKTGQKTVMYAKDAGSYISTKATQVKNSEFVTKVSQKTEEGFSAMVSKTKGLFKKDQEGVAGSVNLGGDNSGADGVENLEGHNEGVESSVQIGEENSS